MSKHVTVTLTKLETDSVLSACISFIQDIGETPRDPLLLGAQRAIRKIQKAGREQEHQGNDVGVGAGTPTPHEARPHGYR